MRSSEHEYPFKDSKSRALFAWRMKTAGIRQAQIAKSYSVSVARAKQLIDAGFRVHQQQIKLQQNPINPETKILDVDWDVRTGNCLWVLCNHRNYKLPKIETLRDLSEVGEKMLLRLKNFGQVSLQEVVIVLGEVGLTLKQENLWKN